MSPGPGRRLILGTTRAWLAVAASEVQVDPAALAFVSGGSLSSPALL
jgi:hypothetical protein